ncbi:hypothetical protein ACFLX7_00440 [Chloroflexota bacterium]
MRELDCDRQPAQPLPKQENCDYRKEEEELVQFDINYLIKCLRVERNASFKILDRPDTKNHHSPQPDYLIENSKTGDLITVEHGRFFEIEETREKVANLVQKSKSGILSQSIKFPTVEQLRERLSGFVSEKLSKGQFKNYGHTERILLARNRWSGLRLHRFIE